MIVCMKLKILMPANSRRSDTLEKKYFLFYSKPSHSYFKIYVKKNNKKK